MFDYIHDEESGGILLIDKPTGMSNEPRPVYAQELDLLGINNYYRYDSRTDIPYMWAEAHRYYYRGKNIFNTKGGSLYAMPEVQILTENDENGNEHSVLAEGTELQPVDMELMIRKNHDLLEVMEQITVKKVYGIYRKYKKKVDKFHVALSGGKDSIVVLDICRKALPDSSYVVIFGDTKMEFPDTYAAIDKIEQDCLENNIEFYRAASHFEPEESWKLFGPPSRVLRWCCTVHKSTPQVIKMREITGKSDYVGLAFVGVRKHESVARSRYDEENYGKKQKGQYSHNPILEWTSAEVWLYIYAHNLIVNEAYKKGNSRAGCLFCPLSKGKSESFRYACYSKEINKFIDLMKENIEVDDIESYISEDRWTERKNGRDLKNNLSHYSDEIKDGKLVIKVKKPSTDWKEWIKTLGEVSFEYSVKNTDDGYIVTAPENVDKTEMKYFKQVFHKSAYCGECRACETNCKYRCISFEDGLHIVDCRHCKNCHDIECGCILYHSKDLPLYGGSNMRKDDSLNSFSDHAPKMEWIVEFFDRGNDFLSDNKLGSMQIEKFKVFLKHSELILNNKTTGLFDIIKSIGIESDVSWAIIFVNLVYNNYQLRWFVYNMPINVKFEHKELEEIIVQYNLSKQAASSVRKSFKRFVDLPMGTELKFGTYSVVDRKTEYLTRTKCNISNPLVLMYALYKYAEENGGMWSFSLSSLLDMSRKSAGISPARIFGFDGDDMEPMLRGLSAKYEDYINVTFTHDLDKITLRDYHSSADVLKLFEEE